MGFGSQLILINLVNHGPTFIFKPSKFNLKYFEFGQKYFIQPWHILETSWWFLLKIELTNFAFNTTQLKSNLKWLRLDFCLLFVDLFLCILFGKIGWMDLVLQVSLNKFGNIIVKLWTFWETIWRLASQLFDLVWLNKTSIPYFCLLSSLEVTKKHFPGDGWVYGGNDQD